MTLSQIFDAHLLVMKYQLGLPADLLDALVLKEFQTIARDIGHTELAIVFRNRMRDTDAAIRLRLPWI